MQRDYGLRLVGVFLRFHFPNCRTSMLCLGEAVLQSITHGREPFGSLLGAVQKKDETSWA